MKHKVYRVTEWITSSVDHTVEATSQREAKEFVAEGRCCNGRNHGEGEFARATLAKPVLIEETDVLD